MSSDCNKPKFSLEGAKLKVKREKKRIGPRANTLKGPGYYLCSRCKSYHISSEYLPCEKVKYANHFEAMAAEFKAKYRNDKGNSRRRERRFYQCERCGFYHLSSKPEKGGR